MKVQFSTSLTPDSGKQNFAIRLAVAMRNLGVRITDKKPDINLIFVKSKPRKGCINIQRLDGAWIDKRIDSKAKNSSIARVSKQCHGIIFQSKYSKMVCEKFIYKPKKSIIIYNGCDPHLFSSPYIHNKPYIITYSRWRPHKRLNQIIDGFLASAFLDTHDLIVCGQTDYLVEHDSIKFMGKTTSEKTCNLVAGCDFVCHLAYLDCCPNSVVEALVAGKNVLHSNSGGTPELVRNDGVCIDEKPYRFEFIDLYNPPIITRDILVGSYNRMKTIKNPPPRADLFIDDTAKKYISFFESFL